MNEMLVESIKAAPEKPGVYIWKGVEGRALYIGKAENLRSRLKNYLNPQDTKTSRLVDASDRLEIIITNSDSEALILEDALVKQNQPRYNVRLRDDKRYPYIRVSVGEKYPRIDVVRRVEEDGNRYFGPYTDAGAVRRIVRLVGEIFGICKCGKDHTKMKRPCLNHSLGLCAGPHVITGETEYRRRVDGACMFLRGDYDSIRKELINEIHIRSRKLEFEKAHELKKKVDALDSLSVRQDISSPKLGNLDILGYGFIDGAAGICQMKVRNGKAVTVLNHKLQGEYSGESGKSLNAFIKQHYTTSDLTPDEIISSVEPSDRQLIEEYLSEKFARKIKLKVCRRGQKLRLAKLCIKNCIHSLKQEDIEKKSPNPLEVLASAFRLPRIPKRIEGYDISNLGGKNTVGSMVVYTEGRKDKRQYRLFKLECSGQDDTGNLAEVVRRRFSHLEWPTPDIVLLDGGRGQLNACMKYMPEGVAVLALAKKQEEIHHPQRKTPIVLGVDNPGLKLLMQVRDEAHRFAKGLHKKRRSNDFLLTQS
ncbi:MAG: excinuclease ABC subunit UvrC [Candidatus Altiarchaeota archaeon]|nr:excinuclease ABC subunit UvrC [Candidatus Altiarchaeota archaeon]